MGRFRPPTYAWLGLGLLAPVAVILGWTIVAPSVLQSALASGLARASAHGWTIVARQQPPRRWDAGPTLSLGTVELGTAQLRWTAENARFVPGIGGGALVSDGPHSVVWGTVGPVRVTGRVQIDVADRVSVSSTGLWLMPSGPPIALHWTPATFDDGAITVSHYRAALYDLAVPWSPGLGRAAVAVLDLLAAPDGSATVPLRHGTGALLAAGFPVLPWAN